MCSLLNHLQLVSRSVCTDVVSQVKSDFAFIGKLLDDLPLKVGTVDAGLLEGSGKLILLPVVMPVPLLVCTVAEH